MDYGRRQRRLAQDGGAGERLTVARRKRALGAAVLALIVASAPVRAVGSAPDGHVLYARHCAPCHGPGGRGDGPDAPSTSVPPRDLRSGLLRRYPEPDLIRRVLSGEPLSLALDPARLAEESREVDALVEHLERLPEIDWDLALRGWDIYAVRCASCHGAYGRPGSNVPAGVRVPRDLASRDFQAHTTDADLREAVRHGRRHMPALTPRVDPDEAKALGAFVRVLSRGFESYSRYCAGCHGVDGRGTPGTLGEVAALPTVVFDEKYFLEHRPSWVRQRAWHMLEIEKPAMPHYRGALDESEVRAILLYLRALDARSP